LPDRGVPEHDVFARVTPSDFTTFISAVKKAYAAALDAQQDGDNYASSVKWRDLFGSEFPLYDKPTPQFTRREEPSSPTTPNRYA